MVYKIHIYYIQKLSWSLEMFRTFKILFGLCPEIWINKNPWKALLHMRYCFRDLIHVLCTCKQYCKGNENANNQSIIYYKLLANLTLYLSSRSIKSWKWLTTFLPYLSMRQMLTPYDEPEDVVNLMQFLPLAVPEVVISYCSNESVVIFVKILFTGCHNIC